MLAPGTRLGPYEIGNLVGAGGMGEVYAARDTRLMRTVAVKVLAEQRSIDTDARLRFESEARVIAGLSHPAICHVYDVGAEDGIDFIVMEIIQGESLARRIEHGPLPIDEVVSMVPPLLDALCVAHAAGIVHRDLKPANIMCSPHGPKLLDFGLASAIPVMADAETTTAGVTGKDVLVGTLRYMAPELLHGLPASHASDLFALGATIYEMLAGQPAFPGPTPAAIITAVLTETPARLNTLRPGVPEALVRAVEKCLEKPVSARWKTAADLSKFLAAPAPVSVRTPRTSTATARARAVRRLAVLPFANASGDPADDYLATGLTDALTAALSHLGSRISVLARISVTQWLRGNLPLSAMHSELKVDAVVEGSVVSSQGQIKVAVRLAHTQTGVCAWSSEYSRSAHDVLTVLGDISEAIAEELDVRLTTPQRRRLHTVQPIDPVAQEAYLRGKHAFERRTFVGMRQAFDYYTQAVRKAPDYALAQVALSEWHTCAVVMRMESRDDGFDKARKAALIALRLDPQLADVHSALGMLAVHEWDLAHAVVEFRQATAINPNLAEVYMYLARCFTFVGDLDRAAELLLTARRLDPLSPAVSFHSSMLALCSADYGRAIAESERTLQLEPNQHMAYYVMGLSQDRMGEVDMAIQTLERASVLGEHHPACTAAMAFVLTRSGRIAQARGLFDRLAARATAAEVTPYDFAEYYAAIGEHETALDYLDRSSVLRLPDVLGVKVDPIFASLRDHPRFAALLETIGLTITLPRNQ